MNKNISSKKEKGDFFEYLCKHLLLMKYSKVCLHNETSMFTEIRKEKNIPKNDEGIDIIIITASNKVFGAQCKFLLKENGCVPLGLIQRCSGIAEYHKLDKMIIISNRKNNLKAKSYQKIEILSNEWLEKNISNTFYEELEKRFIIFYGIASKLFPDKFSSSFDIDKNKNIQKKISKEKNTDTIQEKSMYNIQDNLIKKLICSSNNKSMTVDKNIPEYDKLSNGELLYEEDEDLLSDECNAEYEEYDFSEKEKIITTNHKFSSFDINSSDVKKNNLKEIENIFLSLISKK